MDYAWRGWCECSVENDDDVAMPNVAIPDVAIHDADEEPGVNTEPMATVNDEFTNTLADDTEDNNGISQLLPNVLVKDS
jgi:hypothetical protein